MKLFHKRGRGGLKREKDGVEEEEEEQMGKVVELKKIMVLYQIWHCVVLAGVAWYCMILCYITSMVLFIAI